MDAGSALAGQAGQTMDEVVASVQRVNAIIGEIALASVEQRDGIEQISMAVSQMDGVTQQNAALVEQAAAAADALQQQAASLAEAVSIFQLHAAPAAASNGRRLAYVPAPVQVPRLAALDTSQARPEQAKSGRGFLYYFLSASFTDCDIKEIREISSLLSSLLPTLCRG